jgi:hypothetical protein
MDNTYKIKLENVTKEYDLFKSKSDKLKNFFNIGKVDVPHFWSLKGVSLTIKKGGNFWNNWSEWFRKINHFKYYFRNHSSNHRNGRC